MASNWLTFTSSFFLHCGGEKHADTGTFCQSRQDQRVNGKQGLEVTALDSDPDVRFTSLKS